MVVEGGYAGGRQDAYMYGYKAGKAVVECVVTDRSGRKRSKQAMIISEYVGGKRNRWPAAAAIALPCAMADRQTQTVVLLIQALWLSVALSRARAGAGTRLAAHAAKGGLQPNPSRPIR